MAPKARVGQTGDEIGEGDANNAKDLTPEPLESDNLERVKATTVTENVLLYNDLARLDELPVNATIRHSRHRDQQTKAQPKCNPATGWSRGTQSYGYQDRKHLR